MKKTYYFFSTMMVVLLSLFTFVNTVNAQLYINEFMASNDGSVPGPQADNPDWIEIYNAGAQDVMLGGYYMYDALDVAEAFMIPDTYPDSVTVAAGGFIVFYANKEEASSVLNLNFKLSGDGEHIGLWDASQAVVDTLTFTAQVADISYGRFADGTDNWFSMVDFTPGAANTDPGLTPVEIELYINEFMASNDGSVPGPQGDNPDWIEIYNAGTQAVMLGGYYMYDLIDVTQAWMIPDTYPDSVTVPAGGFIVFYANKEEASSVLNLNFKLSGDGEHIGLWDPEQAVVDTLTFTAQTADISYGRYIDGSDNWYAMVDFTPGASNTDPNLTPVEVELYINEFMASNDGAVPGPQGDFADWIEIYNAGIQDVMLGGYYMYDALDVAEAYQISSAYPDSVTVPAGGFIVFYANKGESSSVLNLNFKLSGDGEQIGLWNPDQQVVDTLTYTTQIADTSYGRYVDGSDNWYLMSDFTPGAPNTNPNVGPVGVELYINEFLASNDFVFPGPQGDFPDWIEIYNAGSEAVMLGGYYMSDGLDVAEAYQIPDSYPDSVTVSAGGFIVFYANSSETSSVMNLNFNLSGGGEQIGFWSPDQVVIDTLTYTAQITDTSYGRYPDGSNIWYKMNTITPGAPNQHSSSISEQGRIVSAVQNIPNPFNTKTNIQFTLEDADYITIQIFDVTGSLVKTVAQEKYQKGTHNVMWDASEMQSGYYFYTLQTSHDVITKKALVIR